MAILNAQARQDLAAEIMRECSQKGINHGLTKAQFLSVVASIDQFMSDNAVALNTAIPQPARGLAPTAFKAIVLRAVIAQRFLKGL